MPIIDIYVGGYAIYEYIIATAYAVSVATVRRTHSHVALCHVARKTPKMHMHVKNIGVVLNQCKMAGCVSQNRRHTPYAGREEENAQK